MIFLDPYGFENELSNLTIKLSKLCYFYHQIIFMVLSLFLHFAGLERLFSIRQVQEKTREMEKNKLYQDGLN